MRNDEDAALAAALGQLAAEDLDDAREAQHAIEWLTGGEGVGQITQDRVQTFLWYELPLKWAIEDDAQDLPDEREKAASTEARPRGADSNDNFAVALALSRAFELLGLFRYAAICTSATTADILDAYARSEREGFAAYRQAEEASGIVPPDLPELEWGSAMGIEEARARCSTADFLELGVAAGEVRPSTRGWRSRQKALTRLHLSTPRHELAGQSWLQAVVTERLSDWVEGRGSDTRRRLLTPVAHHLLEIPRVPPEVADAVEPMMWLLAEVNEGVTLTQKGNLNRALVLRASTRFPWWQEWLARPPRSEEDLYHLHQLHKLARDLGLVRRTGRTLTLTRAGHRALEDSEELWKMTSRHLLAGSPLDTLVAEVFFAAVLSEVFMESSALLPTITQVVEEEGWAGGDSHCPLSREALNWSLVEILKTCRLLRLIQEVGEWGNRILSLNAAGRATALEALRARATGPRRRARLRR